MKHEKDFERLLTATLKHAAKNCDQLIKLRVATERAVCLLKYGHSGGIDVARWSERRGLEMPGEQERIARALELLERGLEQGFE